MTIGLIPTSFHFSGLEQMSLSPGTASRLIAASVLGGIIGMEREWRHKALGLRTNLLMCLGSAFFTLLSAALAGDSPNKGQVAANIVQGVGFLGAGLIMHSRSRVLGLTSAATVFVVAAIGMACGAGLYLEAVLATIIVFFALRFIGWTESQVPWKQYILLYEVRGTDAASMYRAVFAVLDKAGLRMNVVERDSFPTFERVTFQVTANRTRHASLLTDLTASASTDQVISFQDSEQD